MSGLLAALVLHALVLAVLEGAVGDVEGVVDVEGDVEDVEDVAVNSKILCSIISLCRSSNCYCFP